MAQVDLKAAPRVPLNYYNIYCWFEVCSVEYYCNRAVHRRLLMQIRAAVAPRVGGAVGCLHASEYR